MYLEAYTLHPSAHSNPSRDLPIMPGSVVQKIPFIPSPIPEEFLSREPNATHILENNLDKVYWPYLSLNINTHILENNLDKVN